MSRKIVKNFKKKAVMFAVAGAMAFSGAAGAASVSKADGLTSDKSVGVVLAAQVDYDDPSPNTQDREYSHNNSVSVNYTKFRRKYNTTKVYIYPQSGPKLYYRVQGADRNTGVGLEDNSNAHGVPVGTRASFTNYVHENDHAYARLKMRRSMTGQVDSKGLWSPDSTQNYKVYD